MNDPKMATKRRKAVQRAKREDVPKDEAWSTIQHDWGHNFEGHLLNATIDHVYDE